MCHSIPSIFLVLCLSPPLPLLLTLPLLSFLLLCERTARAPLLPSEGRKRRRERSPGTMTKPLAACCLLLLSLLLFLSVARGEEADIAYTPSQVGGVLCRGAHGDKGKRCEREKEFISPGVGITKLSFAPLFPLLRSPSLLFSSLLS